MYQTRRMSTFNADIQKSFGCKVKETKQPEPLKQRPEWIVWRPDREGKKIPRAGPIQPGNPDQPVSALEPESQLPFPKTVQWVQENPEYGLGFALTDSAPFVFVDIDDCRDANTEEIHPKARELINHSGTWADVSVSGAGIHLLGRGEWEQSWHKADIGDGATVEIYDSGRFVAMSGRPLPDSPDCLTDIQDALNQLADEYAPDNPPYSSKRQESLDNSPEINRRLKAMFNSKHGEKYRALWEGNYKKAGFSDRSTAEQSLCDVLAFFLNKDETAIRKAMNKACREFPEDRKWANREGVYRDETVQSALQFVDKTYTEPKGRRPYDLLPEMSTPTLRNVQEAVWEEYPVTTAEIADRVDRSDRHVNRVIDRLMDDGIVESSPDPNDGRKRLYFPAGLDNNLV